MRPHFLVMFRNKYPFLVVHNFHPYLNSWVQPCLGWFMISILLRGIFTTPYESFLKTTFPKSFKSSFDHSSIETHGFSETPFSATPKCPNMSKWIQMVPLWIPTFRCLRNVWPHRPAFHLRLGRFNEERYRPRLLQRLGHDARPRPDLQGDDRWMDGWMDGWTDGWMDGWCVRMIYAYVYIYIMWWMEIKNELYLLNL